MKQRQKIRTIFKSIGYDLAPGESRVFDIDVEAYYPGLAAGRYRISKPYFYDKDVPITPDKVFLVYDEFIIE